jgi:hypothetical protein
MESDSHQKYDLKSIQVEPDNMADVLKMGKGIVRLHSAYNENFKRMNAFMEYIEDVVSGQNFGNVSDKVKYPERTLMKIRKIWNGDLNLELTRDPRRPNIILDRKIVYDEENLDPTKKHFILPPLKEIAPLDHINDNGLFLEMHEEIPVSLAWHKLKVNDINSLWYFPKFNTVDEVKALPLTTTTYFWGKPFFFSLIKQLRTLWDKYYHEMSPMDNEIIRLTKLMQREDNKPKIAVL